MATAARAPAAFLAAPAVKTGTGGPVLDGGLMVPTDQVGTGAGCGAGCVAMGGGGGGASGDGGAGAYEETGGGGGGGGWTG